MKPQHRNVCIVIFMLAFILAGCSGAATPAPTVPVLSATPTPAPTEVLSVAVDQDQVASGPQIVGQLPLSGQRLPLASAIQVTFDREMDKAKTGAAWQLLDATGKPVVGKISWPDDRTLSFQPEKTLEPGSSYSAVISKDAAGMDGKAPGAEIRLEFQTVEALNVGQVFPANDAAEVDGGTNITVIFNRPVAPLLIKEEQSNLPQPIKISPQVTGQGEWVNSSVYVFQPDQLLQSGTRYTVQVAAGLADAGGGVLQNEFSWGFNTRAPRIANFGLKNGLQNPTELIENVLLDQAFVITFLQPMDAASVAKATSLVNRETGRPFPTRLKWNKALTELTIEPVGRYAIAHFYDLTIAKTAQAQDGGMLADGLLLKFSTVPLPRILEASPANGSQAADPSIRIRFSSPMNYGSIKGKVKISPEPPKEAQYWYYDPNTWELNIWGLKPSTDYVVRLQAGMADIYGNTIKDEYSFSFKTRPSYPSGWMLLPYTPLVYREKGAQEFFFEYTNLDSAELSLYKLSFDVFSRLVQDSSQITDFSVSWKPVRVWQPDLKAAQDKRARIKIKLQDADGKALTPGYYFIGFNGSPLDYKSKFFQGAVFIVATDNITFKATKSDALAWVTDLESGVPAANLPVTFYNATFAKLGAATTDKDGLVSLKDLTEPYYASLETGDHLALASLDWGSGVAPGDFGIWENYYGNVTAPFAYVYTERPLYRPGQDVYFKGIVRTNDDLHYSLPSESKVFVTIESWGERIYAEYLPLSQMGTFAGTFKLGDEASLGSYDIAVRYTPESNVFASLSFRVAEYRKPEFQVTASASPTNVLAGEKVNFGLDATYYSGGSVGNASVGWFLESTPFYFQPSSDYSQFSFMDWDRDSYWQRPTSGKNGVLAEGQGTTDEKGHLDVSQVSSLGESKTSQTLTFNANVTDVAGNLVSGQASVVVHQTPVYAGIRSTAYIGKAGEEQQFELATLDWGSLPVAKQAVTVDFVERRWYSVQEQDAQGQLRWVTSVKEIAVKMNQKVVTDENGKATVAFVPPSGGVYKATVTVRDDKGHSQKASAYIWVSSEDYVAWKQTNDRSFSLIADKDTYTPGDTAEILIAQPFEHDVYALLTYERGHIYKQEVLLLKGNSTVYKLPITKDMAPMAYISVTVVSGTGEGRTPDFKIGLTRINVDTSMQTLDVTVSTDKPSAGPGDEVTYMVETKDLKGKPVPAEISLAVVDKAVLALAPSNSAPMLSQFYPEQGLAVRTSLGIVLSAEDYNANYKESETDGEGSGSGGGGGKGEGDLGIITVRQDFKDTAFYEARVMTDETGKAQVKVKLPENLTTWQVDVRAVTDDSRVGQVTGDLLSTKPMFIQLQTPRFFINGDTARVGAVVHNNSADALKVNVSLDAEGVELTSAVEQQVDVPAKQQVYVTWDLTVKPGVERADFIAHAVSGDLTDSSKPTLGTLPGQGIPVYTYSVPEVVGTAGMLQKDDSVTEAIQLPTSLGFGDANLSVEIAPSLAASMENGLTYLEDYPYMCLEQTVSSFLPNVVTSRALKLAGQPQLELQGNLDANVNRALQRIYSKQNGDGGWSWWDSQQSDLQTSAYVVLGLLEAREAGYTVSDSVYDKGISYLRDNLPALNRNDATWRYNRNAFALYVLARAGQLQASKTLAIFDNRHALSLYGKAYLAQAIYLLDPADKRIATLVSDLGSAAIPSAAGTHWEEGSTDYWNWNTDVRTTAIVLDTFIRIDPGNLLVANAVRWLMAHREGGHWKSTQETAWTLMSLTDWLVASKEFETNYQYAVGLNGSLLKEATASPDNLTDPLKLKLQLKDLITDAANYLVITRGVGPGNLYYSAYLNVTLPVEKIEPLDQGMTVSRQYFTLDNPKTPITEIKRGELVRVRVTLVVPDSMHYVVVNDPLPAGLEAIDSTLATSPEIPTSYTRLDFEKRGWGWWYFQHIELRDEKVVLSSEYLPAGTYVFTYMARASTIGAFKVIPPTASEFYFPDVAGRGAGSVFIVK